VSARDLLLDRCVEALARDGFSDLSLREIATAAGTSHRMLIYHFGTRDGLLAEVVARIEAEQRAALADLSATGDDLVETSRSFWLRLSDPALAPAERLFFEVYAQALRGRAWTGTFRESVIAAWEAPLLEMFAAAGDEARAYARLSLAVTRGLLLDLLLTNDRETTAAAITLFGHLVTNAAGDVAPPAG
jgi:AcrR family transcriptional regulator